MGTTAIILLAGAALIYLARRGFPTSEDAGNKPSTQKMRREAGERFIATVIPIRDRIATVQGNHRTVWVRSKLELGNACHNLLSHLGESDATRLDGAYRRFTSITDEMFEPRRNRNGSPGEAGPPDYTATKQLMLEPIRDMVLLAGAD